MTTVDDRTLLALRSFAREFNRSDLGDFAGDFPKDFYGNLARRYCETAKRACELIKMLPVPAMNAELKP